MFWIQDVEEKLWQKSNNIVNLLSLTLNSSMVKVNRFYAKNNHLKNTIFKLRLNAQLRSNVDNKQLKHISIFKPVHRVKKYGNLDMVILYAFVTPYAQNSPW